MSRQLSTDADPAPTTGSRRAENALARQSRRPSRLGCPAGATATPDHTLDNSGFPALLENALTAARAAGLPEQALQLLLTLNGHVPAEVSRRALSAEESAALAARFGPSDTEGEVPDSDPVFTGAIALGVTGDVILTTPTRRNLPMDRVVGIATWVRWYSQHVARFQELVQACRQTERAEVAACREWLAGLTDAERSALLDDLRNAARRTAPFVLYRGETVYTNFREPNNLTGKTLLPSHPQCTLRGLELLSPHLWADDDVVVVACLALLVRSSGPGRVEECNGTQLGLGQVARLFEEKRQWYGLSVDPLPDGATVADIASLADRLRSAREDLRRSGQLYREIVGPLLHKTEKVAGEYPHPVAYESEICARLTDALPLMGSCLAELRDGLRTDHDWLLEPHGRFGIGLEDLIYQVVAATRDAAGADFAMSRGMRSLSDLVAALRDEDWARMVKWELPRYFCCVVPAASALPYFADEWRAVADAAWAMSARMQYNSWHFLAGNLPREEVVEARDYFIPPTMPDLAYFSDQHHRGHVANHVRFSIRSPQPVRVLGRPFNGFVDLRLLRCGGPPFGEPDLIVAHRASGLVAAATEQVASVVADARKQAGLEIRAFDPSWHHDFIAEQLGGLSPDRRQREEKVYE